jgi:hypothetical protein
MKRKDVPKGVSPSTIPPFHATNAPKEMRSSVYGMKEGRMSERTLGTVMNDCNKSPDKSLVKYISSFQVPYLDPLQGQEDHESLYCPSQARRVSNVNT